MAKTAMKSNSSANRNSPQENTAAAESVDVHMHT